MALKNLLFSTYLTLVLLLTACSPEPHLIGVKPKTSQEQLKQTPKKVRILIATTRASSDEEGVFYSSERADQLNFATVNVSIPIAHQTGRVELPSPPPPDPEKHLVLGDAERLKGSDQFLQEVRKELQVRQRGSRTALLFIHGYNTNMTEAVARFAQLVEDSGFRGVPILFSWPSNRRTIDYVSDINSAAISRDALAEFAILMSSINIEGVDILAHSMGNFLAMETFRTMALSGGFDRLNRLQHIVLASPDIDIELFKRQLSVISPKQREKMVVLISRDDKALRISQRISGGTPRVGAIDPEELAPLGVTVVDLTEVNDTNSANHAKFANSPEIVQILGERLAESDTLSTSTTTKGLVLQKAGGIVEIFKPPS